MTLENLVIGAAVVAAVVFGLKYLGVWDKLLGTAKVKTNAAVDAATNGVEKKKMRINALKPILEDLGQQMTDLEAKFGAANGALNRANAKLEEEKTGLKNVRAAIADENNMTDDERTTRQKHLDAVRNAMAVVEAKKAESTGLAAQAKALHQQYADKEREFDALVAEIPAAEARQVVINSKQTAVDFAKKQAQFDEAAKMGADADAQLDEAEAKVDAELKRTGSTKTDTERKAEQQSRDAADAALLAELDGKK
jgi:acyl carrier protein phosphodiesterase